MEPARCVGVFAPAEPGRGAGHTGRPQPPSLATPEDRGIAGTADFPAAVASRPGGLVCAVAAAANAKPAWSPAAQPAVHPDRGAIAGRCGDNARHCCAQTDAPLAAGRRRVGKNGGGGAGGGAVHRRRLAVCPHGPHRDTRRAAFSQAVGLAGTVGCNHGLADGQPGSKRTARDARHDRVRAGQSGGGHTRHDPGQGGVPQAGTDGDR